jgi:hypothetical protein
VRLTSIRLVQIRLVAKREKLGLFTASEVLGGCPMFVPAYMGRKRSLRMLSPQFEMLSREQYLARLAKSVRRGFAPSFSFHVRWGERGAPFRKVGLTSFLISRRYPGRKDLAKRLW